jgi:ribosomal-protein-alanine N-acetyltransferase
MTAQLRPMRWWDIAPVMGIERDLFAGDAWTDAMFWSELAERDTRWYLVAVDDDSVCGYAGLCTYGDDSYVQTIAVDEPHQRRGIGRELLVALLDEATRRGSRRVDLEVRADNDVAIELYREHGFEPIAVRRRYYQPSGTDAVVMRLKALP